MSEILKTSSNVSNVGEKSLEEKANIFSKMTLSYLNPLFMKGFDSKLTHEDLGPTSSEDKSHRLFDEFNKHLKIEKDVP